MIPARFFPALCLTALPALAAPAAAAALTPVGLRCEYQTNPIGIDERAPRLSWRLVSRERGQHQTAYRILVAASPEALRRDRGDLWDSGRIASDQSAHIVYRGRPLASGERAYWKVRVWDARGRVADSAVAFWEMGLLRPEDWKAQWIALPPAAETAAQPPSLEGTRWVWHPEGDPLREAPAGDRFFRRTLRLPADRKIVAARFLLAADNAATLHVNGAAAGQAAGWQNAQVLDLRPHLRPGENVLALQATNGGGPAGVLGRLVVDFERGPRLVLDLDGSWKSADRAPAGWTQAGFDDSAWPAARELAPLGTPPWGHVAVKIVPPRTPSPYLRREFTLERPIRRARLYATALGVYRVHLNGRRVGDQILSPGWTDYRKRVQYQTYDVTPLLRRGSNVIGAILGDGWFAGSLGFDLSRFHFGPGPIRFRAQLEIEYRDGTRERVVTDSSWRGRTGPILESDIYAGETYDARLELSGWDRPGLSDTAAWQPVTVLTDRNPELNAQIDPPIRVTQELPTVQVTEPKPGVYVFDLGQNMVGWARLKARGPAGTRITLRFAEVLNPDGTVYRDNLRLARATDTYILKGEGTEVWEPHFTYHGFRYVEVTGYPGVPSRDAITGRVFHSAMTPTSRFHCSSDLVNRLYRNVTWGQRGNLMSVPTDCPQRDERLGWMGDAQLFARTSCWNMDMSAFYTKWMRDIVDAQSPEGAFSDVSPRVVDLADGAPAWAEAGLVIPWTVYQCYGDTRILERNYDAMRRYVDLLVAANPDLLWLKRRNNDFGDWVAAGEQTNKDLIASAYLAFDLRLLSRVAAILGRAEDTRRYGELADRSMAAFNARFLSPDGRYLGDTQTAYAMTLGLGVAPPERRRQLGDRLVEAIRRRNGRLATGFIGTAFLLPALSDTGHTDVAYRLLTETRYPSWGYMIVNGATTIWELWNSDKEGPAMNSRNHFAFGTVAEWMQRYMAGIDTDPAYPGYRRIRIRPHIDGTISSVRAEYDSLYGTIVSAWERTPEGLVLRVTIPANTTASVYVPKLGRTQAELTESGRSIWSSGRQTAGARPAVPGIVAVADAGDAIEVRIGSGSYEFRLAGR